MRTSSLGDIQERVWIDIALLFHVLCENRALLGHRSMCFDVLRAETRILSIALVPFINTHLAVCNNLAW